MNSHIQFSIKYDGPALSDHQMDVRELAPALIAMADMLKAANHALYGAKSDVRVNVQGSFKGGSFGIDLEAVRTTMETITSLLSGAGPTAAANLVTIATGIGLIGGGGLIALIIKLGGRKPSKVEFKDNSVVFTILESEESETIVTDLETGALWRDRTVRQSLYQVIKPLTQDGIDVFVAGRNKIPEATITKEDAELFEFDESSIELNSNIIEQLCAIESVTFKDDNKWKLNNGQTFYAFMEDMDFLSEINNGNIRFGKGDRLKVQMKIVQHDKANKIETSYHVLKVLDHQVGTQSRLFP